jgi:hypothetical protein
VPDDDDDAPRRGGRREEDDEDEGDEAEGPFRPRKKKSAAGPTRLIIRIVGGVLGGIGLIVLLYWVYSPVGTDYALLCYFPKETTRLTGYDVEEVQKISKMKVVHEMLLNNYKSWGDRRFGQNAGVTTADVSKYLHGTASAPEDERDLPPQKRRGSLTVIRFKKDVDQNTFTNSFAGPYRARERRSPDGKTYHQLYQIVRNAQGVESEVEDISFFFPNGRTLVYGTTERECEEAMTRQPGRVVVEGNMRELADKADGHFFQVSTGWYEYNGYPNTLAFSLGIVDQEVRDQKSHAGVVGTGSWFASNGNDFLYASASLYSDVKTARAVRAKLKESFEKAQADIWQGESGRAGGLDDPFNPKPKDQPKAGGAGGFGGGFGGGTTDNESKEAVLDALSEYVLNARIVRRGRLVVVEGTIPHGTEEQGIFEKFWRVVGSKFQAQSPGGGGFGPPGMMGPGMGPMGPGR